MATSDFALLTVENTGGALALRRKSAAEVVPESASPIYGEAAGNPAVFSDAAGERVLRSAKVSIEPVQSGSGDPSPDNVRPISGWTGARVYRRGKNLWEFESSYNPTGYSVLVNKLPSYLPAGTYTFSAIPDIASDSIVLLGYHSDGTRTEIARLLYATTRQSVTTTVQKDVVSMFFVSNAGGTISDIQLELGSTATDYEPYSGETFDVAFPSEAGTVYGGTVDPAAGTLTVDRVTVALRSNGLNWHASGSYPGGFYADRTAFANVYGIPAVKAQTPFACSHAKSVASVSGYVYGTCFMDYSVNIRIMAEGSTVQDWKDYIQAQYDAETPVQVCLTLVNPVVYWLTPVQIAALAGINTVWADCGPVEIEYVRDTEAVIDAGDADTRAMIGEASGVTASRSLAVGEYVTVGDKLYRVTAAVGSGETLVPGTNVTETTVGAELARIAAMIS